MEKPWEEDRECWDAFVEYQNAPEEEVRKVYTNPPSWSGIRTQYVIFRGGYQAGQRHIGC